MVSRFDPTRFIEAERSQSVAAAATEFAWAPEAPKAAEICSSYSPARPTVATLATIAAPADENLPWHADLASFVDRPCPAEVQASFWTNLLEEAWDTSRTWGAKALSAGWRAIDLFGCNPLPHPFARRVDRDGLVVMTANLLSRVRITNLDAHHAELTDAHGAVMRFRPPVSPGAVLVWDAYPLTSGP